MTITIVAINKCSPITLKALVLCRRARCQLNMVRRNMPQRMLQITPAISVSNNMIGNAKVNAAINFPVKVLNVASHTWRWAS